MQKSIRLDNGIDIKKDDHREISIGQLVESVAKMTGLRCTPAMIYNYEKLGLLPEPSRTEGGFRLFRIEDINLVANIKRWQSQGWSLAHIKEKLLSGEDEFKNETELLDLPINRRTRILEAAGSVFPRKGYAGTTLQDVAEEAGISSSAIYQYFRSKEDLFLALVDNLSFVELLGNINLLINEEKEISYEEVRKSLIDVGEAFLDTHMRHGEIVRMFIAEARDFPEVGKRYCIRLIAPVEKLLNNYLAQQMKRGILRNVDVQLAVHTFYGIFLNFVITQKLLCGEGILFFPKKDRVKKLVDIYLTGMFNTAYKSSASHK
ncbi:MAG: TetR family transcriptional regulator [Anaerolineales bacterium]|nr:TetR family transcriptional regulator [Anaerolineales bacterium]